MSDKTIVFDLDDTICFPNHDETTSEKKYGEAAPNRNVINYMRILREKGYYIIIYSSRRMLTHEGNITKIIDDVGPLTYDWLKKYTVPYDKLIFGKPYSSTYYVDDKAMNIEQLKEWVGGL